MTARRIYVAGHRGLVGSAVCRRLAREDVEVLTTLTDFDLRDQAGVATWFAEQRPDAVVLAAARVGGIGANASDPVAFLYDNLTIAANIIRASAACSVTKLVFLGSSCVYPREAAQPIVESALLAGPLEPTNQWYAVAKIAGLKLCEAYNRTQGRAFVSVMPTNLYGPNDRFDTERGHVIPALMRRFHDAKVARAPSAVVWGSGDPLREFLHVDDLADALWHVIQQYDAPELLNVGSQQEIRLRDLARLLQDIVGYEGELVFDRTKPDGTPRKVLDSAKMRSLGWAPKIGLVSGLRDTYRWFVEDQTDD